MALHMKLCPVHCKRLKLFRLSEHLVIWQTDLHQQRPAVPQLGLVNVSTALRAARSIIDSGNEQIRIREDIAI